MANKLNRLSNNFEPIGVLDQTIDVHMFTLQHEWLQNLYEYLLERMMRKRLYEKIKWEEPWVFHINNAVMISKFFYEHIFTWLGCPLHHYHWVRWLFKLGIVIKKNPHMVFLPHVQLDQNAILDNSIWTWPFWLCLFGWFFLLGFLTRSFFSKSSWRKYNLGSDQKHIKKIILFKINIKY